MSNFALRGSTALLALSLALAAPLPLLAQDSPSAVATTAPWQVVERLGLRLPVPGAAVVTDTSDTLLTASTLGDGQTGIRIEVQALGARDFAQFPAAPGTPEFAALLSQLGAVTVAPTGITLQLGDLSLDGYGGSGTRTLDDGSEIDTRMLFLVSPGVEGDNTGYFVAISSSGLGADEAARVEAEFVAGLGLAAPAPAEAAPTASDTPVADAPTDTAAAADEPIASDTPAAVADTPPATEPAPAPLADADLVALAAGLPEPSALLPEGWTQYARMGMMMAVPEGATINTDSDDENDLAFSAGGDLGGVIYELGGRVLSADAMTRQNLAPDTEGFRAILERWSGVPVAMTDRHLSLGDTALRVYFGAGPVADGGDTMTVTVVYLAADTVAPDGSLMLLGGSATGDPAVAAAGLLGDFVESLGVAAPAPAPTPETGTETLIDGLATLTLPEGLSIASIDRNPAVTDGILAEGENSVSRLVAGRLTHPIEAQLDRLLDRIDSLGAGLIGDMPVWIVAGTATRTMDNAVVTGADAPPARVIVPQACVAGNAPYVVAFSVLPGDEARFDALIGGLTLSAPEGATECPDLFLGVRQALAADVTPEPQQPTMPDTGGKDPSEVTPATPAPNPAPIPAPVLDPEAAAWAQAQASGAVDAVLDYVARYPRGLHSGEARTWLRERAIVPADEQRPAQAAPMPPDADTLAWEAAMHDSTAAAMWTYLKARPQGAHRPEAMGIIDSLRGTRAAPERMPMPATPPAAPGK